MMVWKEQFFITAKNTNDAFELLILVQAHFFYTTTQIC